MRQTAAKHIRIEHSVVAHDDAALRDVGERLPHLGERRCVRDHLLLDVVDANIAPVELAHAFRRTDERDFLIYQLIILKHACAECARAQRRGVSGLEIQCKISHCRASRPAASARSFAASNSLYSGASCRMVFSMNGTNVPSSTGAKSSLFV